MRVKVNAEAVARNTLKELIERGKITNEEAEKILNTFPVEVLAKIAGHKIELEKGSTEICEECYVSINVVWPENKEVEVVKKYNAVCQDGPDVWSEVMQCYRVTAPAIVKVHKTADRVYPSWTKYVIVID